ncbi:MAG: DUF131 domain-containing protein [Thermoplasmata archaeon]|nr:DUF131 domain-containing protein [Thermoplasmata archaeon]
MEGIRAVPVVLLALGAVCVGYAVATGQASEGVLLIFPFVIGSSWLLALGVVLLFFGLLTLPLAFGSEPPSLPHQSASIRDEAPPSSSTIGGVVLLGPVPIFFGGWRHPLRWVYWLAVAVGLVVLFVFVFLWLAGRR